MATYTLPADNNIHGAQLVEEITRATGAEIGDRYVFIPPRTVRLPDEFDQIQAQVQGVIDAHIPDPLYFQSDKDIAESRGDFEDMAGLVGAEIDYLNGVIDSVDGMNAAQVRDVVKRLAQQNLGIVKAFRFLQKRLG